MMDNTLSCLPKASDDSNAFRGDGLDDLRDDYNDDGLNDLRDNVSDVSCDDGLDDLRDNVSDVSRDDGLNGFCDKEGQNNGTLPDALDKAISPVSTMLDSREPVHERHEKAKAKRRSRHKVFSAPSATKENHVPSDMSEMLGVPYAPGVSESSEVPDAPSMSGVLGVPTSPEVPDMPDVSDAPDMSGVPRLPDVPDMPDALDKLVSMSIPDALVYKPGKPDKPDVRQNKNSDPLPEIDEYTLAQYLKLHKALAVIDGRLYIFEPPCFRYYGKKEMLAKMKAILPRKVLESCKMALLKRVLEQLETEPDLVVLIDKVQYNPADIVFANGVYNVRSHSMRDGAPEDCFVSCNSSTFRKKCGKRGNVAKQFFHYASNGDTEIEELMWLTVGVMLSTETAFKKFFYLYGPPNTGKSIFGNLLQRLIGLENCSNIPLAEIDSKYHGAEMIGKRANISLDQPNEVIRKIGILKQITSGGTDSITTERKYGAIERLDSRFIKLLFAGNSLPKLKEYDEAFWSRMVLIPFENQVPESERNLNLIEDLMEEKNYIIARALDRYETFLDDGMVFPVCARAEELKNLEQPVSDIDRIRCFIETYCEFDTNEFSPSSMLYEAYLGYCKEEGCRAVSQKKFALTLYSYPNIEYGRKESIRGGYGIRLKENADT